MKKQWAIVAMFALAMAWFEAAVVMYLRFFLGRVDPYQADPLPMIANLGEIELVREAATMIMLLCVGWLAGQRFRSRVGFFLIAFGIWDILYYLFLSLMGDWPNSLMDWDILFLIPLPWWGPILAPMLIASLMIVFGTILVGWEGETYRLKSASWLAMTSGVVIALVAFMWDSLKALPGGVGMVRSTLPVDFQWGLFGLAIGLMMIPILDTVHLYRKGYCVDKFK